MPPSESKGSKNRFFAAVYTRVSERINRLDEDENHRRFYMSLLAGGIATAGLVVSVCEGVKGLWGGGDEEKALALTRLFTLMMLSQCYRWLGDKEPEKQRATRQATVARVLLLFGDDSEGAIKDFFDMDTQFKFDLENRPHMVHLSSLLLARACQACGHKCIEWSKVSYPVKSLETLTRSRAIIDPLVVGNPNDIKALWHSHMAGAQVMVKYHEEQTKP
jgi:hypothetical protein